MEQAGFSVRRRGRAEGFTLVEVLIAMFLIGIGVLAAAPMFIYAMQGNAVGGDFGSVGATAVEHMELLRSQDWGTLTAGGSLSTSVANYFDTSDPDVTVRWSITDNTTPAQTKTIQVRAVANRQVVGERKDVTLTTIRGK
jgi:prepilin-type N-terminal cleavage/methylation domain-containing protein